MYMERDVTSSDIIPTSRVRLFCHKIVSSACKLQINLSWAVQSDYVSRIDMLH